MGSVVLALPCPVIPYSNSVGLDRNAYIFLTSFCLSTRWRSVLEPSSSLAFRVERCRHVQAASLKGKPSPVPQPNAEPPVQEKEFTEINEICSITSTEERFGGWEMTRGQVSASERWVTSSRCTNSAYLSPLKPLLQIKIHGPMSFALVTRRTRYWQPVGILSCFLCNVAFKYASSSHKHKSWQWVQMACEHVIRRNNHQHLLVIFMKNATNAHHPDDCCCGWLWNVHFSQHLQLA